MSEYQYYEFQAIDRPLTEKEESYIASLSSRVHLTPDRAIFTYSYGDFRGDPIKVLQKYFDAMLYLANWGTRQLAFRLPRSVVDPETLAPYCVEDMISTDVTKSHVVLDICFNEEEGLGWIDGEGWLPSLASLRQDILRGDFRTLYLAWLKAISFFEEDAEDFIEPPVPAGLQKLSPPLRKFVELFEVDEDWIDAASEISPQGGDAPEQDFEALIARLPERERNDFLVRLVKGEPNLDAQLAGRLRELSSGKSKAHKRSPSPRRNVAELFAAAQKKAELREERERKEAERARVQRFTELSKKEPQLWDQIFALIENKKPKAYDEAIKLLVEMRELAEYLGRPGEFQTRINRIYEQYSNRPSLLDRLRGARMLKQDV